MGYSHERGGRSAKKGVPLFLKKNRRSASCEVVGVWDLCARGKVQVKCVCRFVHKFVRVHAHFNFALLKKFYGVSILYIRKKNPSLKHAAICCSLSHPHHSHNYLSYPPYQIASPEVNSCFGPVKWQNLSTVPDERVCHLRIAVVSRNQPQNEKYFDFVPLLPPDQIASPEVNSCPFWTW
jgi:hypothetical protein